MAAERLEDFDAKAASPLTWVQSVAMAAERLEDFDFRRGMIQLIKANA